MSHPWLLSHLPLTTSTSSSSFTLPSTTQEHAAQSVQQEQLREHPHHAHLQAPSVHSGVKTCRVADTRAPQLPQRTDFAEVWSSVSLGGRLGPPTSARNRDAGENERKTPTPDATNTHRERKSKSEKENGARDDTKRRKEVEQKQTVSAQRRKDLPARNKNMTSHETCRQKSGLIAGLRG